MNKITKHDDAENRAASSSRAVLVIGVFIVYTLAYPPLRALLGSAAGLLAIAPVMLTGWVFGLRGGLLAGLIITPLHTILMNLTGHPGWDVILRETNGLGLLATTAIGAVTGYHRDVIRAFQAHIVERRQVEDKLRESEERYRRLADHAPDIIFRYNLAPTMGLAYINPAVEAITGYTPEECYADSSLMITMAHPDDVPLMMNFLQSLTPPEEPLHMRWIGKDGATRWMESRLVPVRDAAGNLIAVEGITRDVTERKRAEDELGKSENKLRLMLDTMSEGLALNEVVYDENGEMVDYRILEVNRAFYNVADYTDVEVIGNVATKLYGMTPEFIKDFWREHKEKNQVRHTEMVSPLNNRNFYVSASPFVGDKFVTSFIDITERKQAEAITMARLRLLDFATTHSLDEILQAALDEAELLTGSNMGFLHFLDEDQNTLSLRAWSTRTMQEFCKAEGKGMHYPVDKAGVWADCVRERRPVIHNDYASLPHRQGLPEGHANVVRELVVPVMRNERFVAIFGLGNKPGDYTTGDVDIISHFADLAWDIAERKRAEEELRRSEARYRAVVENQKEFIVRWKRDGTRTFVNEAYLRCFGLTYDQAISSSFIPLVAGEDRRAIEEKIARLTSGAVPFETDIHQSLLPNGELAWQEWTDTAIRDEAGNLIEFQSVGRDITDRKEAEIALAERSRFISALVDTTPAIIYVYDLETNSNVYSNHGLEQILGYTTEQVKEMGMELFTQLLHPNDLDSVIAFQDKIAAAADGDVLEIEYRIQNAAGRWINLHSHESPFLRNQDGSLKQKIGIAIDVTARKQAEEALQKNQQALRESEALYRQAIEVAGAVPYYESYYDEGRKIRYDFIGEGIRQITGYGPEEFTARIWDTLVEEIHPVDELEGLTLEEAIEQVRGGQYPIWKCEHRIRDREGIIHWVFEAAVELRDENGVSHGSIGMYQDITARKQAEESLRRSEERYRSIFQTSGVSIWEEDFSEVKEALDELRSQGVTDFRRHFEEHPEFVREAMQRLKVIEVNEMTLTLYGAKDKAEFMVSLDRTFKSENLDTYKEELITLAGGKTYFEGEVTDRTLQGDTLYLWRTIVFPEEGASFKSVLVCLTDITARKQAEEALRESEARLKFSQRVAHVGHWTWDTAANRVTWSDEMKRIFGLDPDTFDGDLNKVIAQAIHPDDREKVNQSNASVLTEQKPAPLEYRVVWPDGSVHTVWAEAGEKILDTEGKIIRLSGIVQDITARKQAEEALQQAEKKYRTLVEQLPIVVYSNPAEDVTSTNYVSPQIKDFLGYTQEEWLADPKFWSKALHPDDRTRVLTAVEYMDETGEPFDYEYRMIARDGHIVWIRDQATLLRDPDNRPLLWQGLMSDITARKQAEDALRKEGTFRKSVIERAGEGLCVCHAVPEFPYVQFTVWNERMIQLTGYTMEEINERGWYQSLYPDLDYQQKAIARMNQMRDGRDLLAEEWEITRADGQKRTVAISTTLLLAEEGVARVLALMTDTTDRRQAKKKLEQQNLRLKALREIDGAILAADSVENIVDAALGHIRELIGSRRASMTLIDWGTNEAVVFDVSAAGEPSIRKGTRLPLATFQDMLPILSQNQSILINDLSALANPPSPFQVLIQDGLRSVCILPIFSQGSLIGTFSTSSEIPGFFDEEKIALGREVANQVAIAVTQSNLFSTLRGLNAELEQRVADRTAQLQAANKELEAFSYSVSHDLRAPLRGIDGFSQALTRKYSDALGEDGKHYLTRIQENTRRMGQLIDDLLSLSRITRREMKRDHVNLSKIAREIADELSAQEPGRRVQFEIEEQVEAKGDAGLLKIVLQNLLGNAFKFTSTRKRAIIEFGIASPAAVKYEAGGNGETVYFVRDNGVGFDITYANKLFGAFQRLHAMDEFPGTGIGLATVQRIIHRHGGRIWVDAELEKGATFYFTLGAAH